MAWRNCISISRNTKDKRRYISSFKKLQKFVCRSLSDGHISTAVLFPSGKVAIGNDVWRLSYRTDCCEYPYVMYDSLDQAKCEYSIETHPSEELIAWKTEETWN